MRLQEFITKYKSKPQGFCPCIIDANGEVFECLNGHLNALLELQEDIKTLADIPKEAAPLFYMIVKTNSVIVDYEAQVYSWKLTPEQEETLQKLEQQGLISLSLKNLHGKTKL